MKFQYYNGVKFTKDNKTGYYLNSTLKKRMHVYVWEYNFGKVERGCEIHHIDGNKANNNIKNLKMLKKEEHQQLHAEMLTEAQREWRKNNLIANALPKAKEWHKSEQGREWHKLHYQQCKEKLHQKKEAKCANCGNVFTTEKGKFCCNACKSAFRRKQGKDLVSVKCIVCGNEFKTNKYRKAKTCSRSCANKLKGRSKNESN